MSQHIRHILDLSAQERQAFVQSFDHILTDCDGVLWTVYEPIPNVGDALTTLLANGKTIRYITNNSVRPFESYATQLGSIGIKLEPTDLIHPAVSIVQYLNSIHFEGPIYCLATESFKSTLRAAGFGLIDGPTDPVEESFKKILATVNDKAPVKAVIVDVDFNLNYPKLLRAELYLKGNPECLLIAGATDKLLHVKHDFKVMGPGYFSEMLEQATGRRTVILGKPGAELASQISELYGTTDARRVLFVGDMLQQDIAFASRCGFQKLLVMSGGATREEMVNQPADGECVPDYVADSLADLRQLFD
ncbi:uncharacterized protein LOC129761948 [Toxorhynchites rutilus septentrionalis]|uniref:uncharacterized protein LOC129761948 n=1 Tax=Toxorhynchites rutilus septentrionalis TaxID=329112 RepID=UPI002479A8EA|nr:uncharacterized protein LOC129761948 [Toxorhynchites rutilus septentrionalis]